ncbi:hypothetical protein JCM6882_008556 [Rhodosporidiobolus microsporus]
MLFTQAPLRTLRPRLCTCRLARRSFSRFSALEAPPYLYTPLPSRALVSVQGADAQKFLQGLVSNDVRRLAQPGEEGKQRVLYAGLFKADGRYMHDLMLYPPSLTAPTSDSPTTPSYLIEHDSSFTPTLRTYLKRHKLRSKVRIGAGAEEKEVTAAWRNAAEESTRKEIEEAERWLEERKVGLDPRVMGMGYRWVAEQGAEQPPPHLFKPVTPEHFHLHRLIHAIPEGPSDFPALPLEANFDFLNGVDYRKGCYVGQELTARTHHKGVVRKRGVVFRLFREGEDIPTEPLPSPSLLPYPSLFPLPPPGSTLTPLKSSSSPRARASGKLGTSLPLISPSGVSTCALAYGSVRLDHLEGEGEFDGVFVVKAPVQEEGKVGEGKEAPEVGDGAGESQEEGGRWFAKGFMPEWLSWKLEEEAVSKGL